MSQAQSPDFILHQLVIFGFRDFEYKHINHGLKCNLTVDVTNTDCFAMKTDFKVLKKHQLGPPNAENPHSSLICSAPFIAREILHLLQTGLACCRLLETEFLYLI